MGKGLDHPIASVVGGEEAFAAELALALDDIERLSLHECGGLFHLASNRVEPVLGFLSLHAKLAFVLCSPHAMAFCDSLRAWGANASIDRKIAQHWPGYRPNWQAGRAMDDATIRALCKDPIASWLIGVRSAETANPSRPTETAANLGTRSETLERLTPGTVFRLRCRGWHEWKELKVVKVSTQRNFHCLEIGSKAKKSTHLYRREWLHSSEWSIEIVG